MYHVSAMLWQARVSIAGDIAEAKNVLQRRFKIFPRCVTVTPTTFVYKGGREEGMIIQLTNYPRFPESVKVIKQHAINIAETLIIALGQHSALVECNDGTTVWVHDGDKYDVQEDVRL